MELLRHLDEVRVPPSNDGKGWHYVAEGDWDLLGADSKLVTGRQFTDWRPVMVAGVRLEPLDDLRPGFRGSCGTRKKKPARLFGLEPAIKEKAGRLMPGLMNIRNWLRGSDLN
jgi:hypothetical protein